MSHPIHPLDVILHKRDGLALSPAEIAAFVQGVTGRSISDAQTAAFLMAVFQRGLNSAELASLTEAMRTSGETFDATALHSFTVDKHSTGGVGDKTSLLLAPIVAAAGLARPNAEGVPGICVPMISGRSLGHTGGTLDKLETIPGFDTQLPLDGFERVLRQAGAALIGQTPRLVPADRILYALRDHTGTVASPYLITASIMSKKLAESLNGLVLDVKTGSGAFMRTGEDARLLARLMVETGEAAGTRTVALLTRMDQPLGRFAGNWLEVRECVEILKGERHPMSADLLELTLTLAGWMLHLAGLAPAPEAGATLAERLLHDGSAWQAWLGIVRAQGGDVAVFDQPEQQHRARASRQVLAPAGGYLAAMDCTEVGWAVQRLGAGRAHPGDPVSAAAGLEVHAKLGMAVRAGEPLFTLFADDATLLDEPARMLLATCRVSPGPPVARPLVEAVIERSSPPPTL